MNSIQGVILVFLDEKVVFLREQATSLYSPSAYFIAKVFSEIPGFIVFPSIYCVIAYFGLGLNTTSPDHFFIFHGTAILTVVVTSGYSFIIGIAVSERQVVMAMIPVTIIPLMLFSGFYVNQSNIPFFLKPFEYISMFKYCFQVFAINEYNGLTIDCNGRDPLKEFNFRQTMTESALALLGLAVGFYTLAYLILLLVAKRSKKILHLRIYFQ